MLTHLQRPAQHTAEILIWHDRFRFSSSLKIAVIHDVTVQLFPELHTPVNVIEYHEFVQHARKHADLIATVSEQSRGDIIDHLDMRPNSVRVVRSQIHPIFWDAQFDPRVPERHGLVCPYLLGVGAIEPRKNLRRLVEAFAILRRAGALQNHVLAIAGPQGWDNSYDQFLAESDVLPHIRRLGFVPLEDLPSLYHYASAFVYPSLYEGFGLPVLEALCSSAAVLTSNAASLAEIAGGVVKTFDPFDATSMAEAIFKTSSMTRESELAYRRQCRMRGEELLQDSSERPTMATLLASHLAEDPCASRSYSPSLT